MGERVAEIGMTGQVTGSAAVLRMGRMVNLRRALIVILFGIWAALAVAQPEPTAVLNFMVVKDENGKPVRNASVVLHPVNEKGKQSRGGYELKADADGKASFDGAPYGKLRVQVLAPGFQTFGEDYEVGQPTMEITVRLKRPQQQYSIYEDHPGEQKKDDQKKPQ